MNSEMTPPNENAPEQRSTSAASQNDSPASDTVDPADHYYGSRQTYHDLPSTATFTDIDEEFDDALLDRLRRERLENVDCLGISPSIREFRQRLIGLFNVFRQNRLHISLDEPFTIPMLIDFVDFLRAKMVLPNGNPALDLKILVNVWITLVGWGFYSYQDFKVDEHAKYRARSFFDYLKRENLVITGLWKRRQWLSFSALSSIVHAWLEHHIKNGTTSWDHVIARAMSVVLISALGVPAGEVVLSRGCKDAYLRYEHIEIVLDDDADETSIDLRSHLHMTVELHHCKGQKPQNDSSQMHFRPKSTALQHTCVVSLLLTHALRQGLVHGTDLQAVLLDTLSRPGRILHWVDPLKPVIPAFNWSAQELDLDKAADLDSISETVKSMGIVAGGLGRMYRLFLQIRASRIHAHLDGVTTKGSTRKRKRTLPEDDENCIVRESRQSTDVIDSATLIDEYESVDHAAVSGDHTFDMSEEAVETLQDVIFMTDISGRQQPADSTMTVDDDLTLDINMLDCSRADDAEVDSIDLELVNLMLGSAWHVTDPTATATPTTTAHSFINDYSSINVVKTFKP